MKTARVLRIVNVILAVDFLIIAFTAIFHELIIPTGYYGQFHALPGFLFIILVLIHIILNRKWIKSNYLKKKES